MTQNPHPQFIDVDKVERELVSALEADRKYSRENDAKFRAVHQKVATYEEFRDIVKASHLNSLDRDDITGRKGRKQPWNPAASSSSSVEVEGDCGNHGNNVTGGTQTQFNNVQEFMREWRRLKGSQQEQYCMGLLGEFLEVLNLQFVDDNSDVIMDTLKELSRSSRFSLALSFLGKGEKKAAKELFEKLRREVDNAASADHNNNRTTCLQELAKLYNTVTGS